MNAIVRDISAVVPTVVPYFSEEQISILRDTHCRGATDAEFWYFVRTCERTRLDPFQRQIYAVRRWDSQQRAEVQQVQIAIDGFRLIAERSGLYEGQTAPQWCGRDGVWRDVWLAAEPPAAARVGALRRGFREPMWGVARHASYVQNKREGGATAMWSRMPDVMLAKCAEALALRKAFPAELSGLYSGEEMGQAGPELQVAVAPAGATGSEEVRVLSAALHEPDRETPAGPDALAHLMYALDRCKTAGDVYTWIRASARLVSAEPDTARKRGRWKAIQRKAAGVTPPVRVAELTRAFGEALASRDAAALPEATQSGERERDPLDELPSVETSEALYAWFSDHRDWLAGIEQGSETERNIWNEIRGTAARVGNENIADELSERLG